MSNYQRVVLVTGSNTGIGFEIVRQLALKGELVYLAARTKEKAEDAVAKLKAESNVHVKFVVLDNTDVQSINKAKGVIEKDEGRLDVLINNAGNGFLDRPQTALDVSIETLQVAFDVNFYGTIQTTLAFLPLIRKAKRGYANIVFVSSDMASNTFQAAKGFLHCVAYNTSKAATNSYAIAIAAELKSEGVHVNVVTPGFTSTKLNGFAPGGRTPAEGASTIVQHSLLGPEHDVAVKFFNPEGEFSW